MNEVIQKILMATILPLVQEIIIGYMKKISPEAKEFVYDQLDKFYAWTKTNTWAVDDEFALFLLGLFGRPTPVLDVRDNKKQPPVYDPSLIIAPHAPPSTQ